MVIQKLIDTLRPLCPEIIQQGSMPQDAQYPPRLFTFWNSSTEDRKHYNNATHGYVWEVEVNFYSTDPADVYNTLDAAKERLQAEGWVVSGKGHAVASDTTTHTGRGFTALYIEQ
jgi:hypothetical protein